MQFNPTSYADATTRPVYYHITPSGFTFSSPVSPCTLLARPTPHTPTLVPGHIDLIKKQLKITAELMAEVEKYKQQIASCGAGAAKNHSQLLVLQQELKKLDPKDPNTISILAAFNDVVTKLDQMFKPLGIVKAIASS